MYWNYLKVIARSMARQKAHTFINIAGLALGMVCCLCIYLWVRDEKSIDNFHLNGKHLYAVYETIHADGTVSGDYSSGTVTGATIFPTAEINKFVPGVDKSAFYTTGYELPWGHPESFQYGEKKIKLEGSRASKDFLTMFSYKVLAGQAATALDDISSIAISRKMAGILFGTPEQALHKTLRYENRLDFKVSAVFEDLPAESSLRFDFLINWLAQQSNKLEYSTIGHQTYLQLSPNANASSVVHSLNDYVTLNLPKIKGTQTSVGLQRFGDVYLRHVFVNGVPGAGRIQYVRIFSGVAIFILLIACINFMNLATARAVKRAREVGVRKAVGSTRINLVMQFFAEAICFAMLAALVTILLVILIIPGLNALTGKSISFPASSLSFWIYISAITIITGLVAGSYPALYLSALKPVRVLKGILKFSRSAILLRKGLTVFQFTLSIILVLGTIVVMRQIDFIQHGHLGFDRENLVYVRIEGDLIKEKNYLLFKEKAAHLSGIAMIDRSTEAPQQMGFVVQDDIKWEGKPANSAVGFKPASVGFDFVRLMHLQIVKGRDFSAQIATDSSDAFLVNEEAVKEMGLKDPIGKWVSAWKKKGHIIGVLRDYHTASMHEPIMPVLLDVKEYEDFGVIIARTAPGRTKEALAGLEKVYREVDPAYAFAYQFVDEEYNKMYASELVISRLTAAFATLAIMISCLGLLGLAMFSAAQRTKEIGIRKVLGASLGRIVVLFSKDFIELIILAFVIAAPVAWVLVNGWLQDFVYRVSITWWMFALAGGAAIVVAIATIGYQALRSARANPVQSLKSE